jgi:hypothetical protein
MTAAALGGTMTISDLMVISSTTMAATTTPAAINVPMYASMTALLQLGD